MIGRKPGEQSHHFDVATSFTLEPAARMHAVEVPVNVDAIRRGIVPFDFRGVGHDACARGDWDEVRRQLIAMGRKARAFILANRP